MSRLLATLVANRRLWQVVLAVYWISLFLGTHFPSELSIPHPTVQDKVLHFLGFAGLGMLVVLALRSAGWAVGIRGALAVWLLLAFYAVLDETTQPLVNRSSELWDWIADVAGAALGIALGQKLWSVVDENVRRADHDQ